MKGNAKNSIYINEAGVYAMAFGSHLPAATAFKSWVLKEVLPSIRRTGSYQLNAQLQTIQSELANQRLLTDELTHLAEEARFKAETEQKRADDAQSQVVAVTTQLNRLYIQNSSLVLGKKFEDKLGSIYIIASQTYATQGIYKVGRTKSMVSRIVNHNSSRVLGDYHVILKEFKVNNATLIEGYIHSKLQNILIKGEIEFFKAPYASLEAFVQKCVDIDSEISNAANGLVDMRYSLELKEYKAEDWMAGIPEETFGPGYSASAKICLAALSDDDKHKVVRAAITEFLKLEKGIDYVLPNDASRIIVPKIKVRWSDLTSTIKTWLQHGEGAKLSKQSGEWSDIIAFELKDAAAIDFVAYRPPKNKT